MYLCEEFCVSFFVQFLLSLCSVVVIVHVPFVHRLVHLS